MIFIMKRIYFILMLLAISCLTFAQEVANPNDYGFNAAICYNGSFIGNCVIVDEEWVIAPAYMVDGTSPSAITIEADGTDRYSFLQTRSIEGYILHPDYTSWDQGNSVALIKLASPLTFNANCNSIEIHPTLTYEDLIDSWLNISGYMVFTQAVSMDMYEYDAMVISQEEAFNWHNVIYSDVIPMYYNADNTDQDMIGRLIGASATYYENDVKYLIGQSQFAYGTINPYGPVYFSNLLNDYDFVYENISSSKSGTLVNMITRDDQVIAKNVEFKLYPNPTADKLNIAVNTPESYSTYIYSIDGRMISQSEFNMGLTTVTLVDQIAGVYFVVLEFANGEIAREKFIKN